MENKHKREENMKKEKFDDNNSENECMRDHQMNAHHDYVYVQYVIWSLKM